MRKTLSRFVFIPWANILPLDLVPSLSSVLVCCAFCSGHTLSAPCQGLSRVIFSLLGALDRAKSGALAIIEASK